MTAFQAAGPSIPGRTHRALTSPQLPNGVGLVSRVALALVEQAMKESGDREVLFMISGLDKLTTCAVASTIKAALPDVTVEVHEDMADDTLPTSMVSRRSLADYRNAPRRSEKSATVFAHSPRELDVVGRTAGEIQQISEERLIKMPLLWFECSPELQGLSDRSLQHATNILEGLAAAQILTTGLRMYGDFVERLDTAYESFPFEGALSEALPALRIPKGAGKFKKLGARGRLLSVDKWAERFRELHAAADDALHLRRDGSRINRAWLTNRLDELTKENQLTDDELEVLTGLVNDPGIEPGQWTSQQEKAAQLHWDAVQRLVKLSKRKAQEPLGQMTLAAFASKMPTALEQQDREVLEVMGAEDDAADDDERAFFFRHRANIAECGRALLKRWEVCVFRKTEQHSDLALGLFLTIADLVEGTVPPLAKPLVLVRLQGSDRQKFWDAHNVDLCRYLRDRYRGLPDIFAAVGVLCDFGMCWANEWDSGKSATYSSKTAREFRFDIFLLEDSSAAGGRPTQQELTEMVKAARSTTQLVWSMPGDSVASAFHENILEVANGNHDVALLARGRFSRAQDQDRSTDGRISLVRRTTFQDADGRPNGILVDSNDKELNVGLAFTTGLAKLRAACCQRWMRPSSRLRSEPSRRLIRMPFALWSRPTARACRPRRFSVRRRTTASC